MQIKVKTIRNLEIIEEELNSISSGVLALPLDEGFEQFATSFVYYKTNIYAFIQSKELYRNLRLGSITKFTAIKEISSMKKNKTSDECIYSLFSISVSGIIKNVEETKLNNTVKQHFFEKYSGKLIDHDSKSKSFSKLICLDSEELISVEEIAT